MKRVTAWPGPPQGTGDVDRPRPYWRDQFPGVDEPINAIAYDLTEGGDTVRRRPWLWSALESHVWQRTRTYEDLACYTRTYVDGKLNIWLQFNERKP